jgi:RecA-family ATPase
MSASLNESAARAWREERARAELARTGPRLAAVRVGHDAWEGLPLPEGEDAYGIQAPSAPFEEATSRPGPDSREPPLPLLEIVNASSLVEEPAPPREWLIPGLIPAREITMLSGDGGTGKSLLALQLAVAHATCTGWAGQVPDRGRTLFVSAEDDIPELHRRLAAIIRVNPVKADDLQNIDLLSLAGRDAVLAAPGSTRDMLRETRLFKALEAKIEELQPDVLILDTLADLFGGDEIKRPHARQFISLLRGLAIRYRLTILLLSHPSLSGMSSGTGTSGSTAWSNSVRSRLYLESPKGSEDDAGDDDRRILTTKKANYGRAGGSVALRWRDGVFVLDSATDANQAQANAADERAFLSALAEFAATNRPVSDKRSNVFAPTLFANHMKAKDQPLSVPRLEAAMQRLFAARRIHLKSSGPPSRQRQRIVAGTPAASGTEGAQ